MKFYAKLMNFCFLELCWKEWHPSSLCIKCSTVASLLSSTRQASSTHHFPLQILHSIGLKFTRQVREAADLDSVLALHNDYVATIFDRCLLNKKVCLSLSLSHHSLLSLLSVSLSLSSLSTLTVVCLSLSLITLYSHCCYDL